MKLKKLSPLVLRVGLAFVFIWFGSNQLMNQSMWLSLIPSSLISITGISAKTFVLINGVFEILMALLLAIGFKIRIVATLLLIHLMMIVGDLGLNAIGVRDIGLIFATLSVAFHGADDYSYDQEHSEQLTNI